MILSYTGVSDPLKIMSQRPEFLSEIAVLFISVKYIHIIFMRTLCVKTYVASLGDLQVAYYLYVTTILCDR